MERGRHRSGRRSHTVWVGARRFGRRPRAMPRHPLGSVLWHITMSLDGFIAGRGDSMDWAFGHASGPNAAVEEVVQTTRAILAGRRWYGLAVDNPAAAPYGGAWTGPILVLTHHPPPTSPVPGYTFLSDSIGAG